MKQIFWRWRERYAAKSTMEADPLLAEQAAIISDSMQGTDSK